MKYRKYLLLSMVFVLCSWTTPSVNSSRIRFNTLRDIDRNLPPPSDYTIAKLQYAWHGLYLNQAYIEPFLGPCDSKHVDNCVQYTYLATYQAFEQDISYRDILAITYWGELAIFGRSSRKLKMISYEALFRNFFDSQGGGCRFNHDDVDPVFDCRYDNMIEWLSTSQHWRDAAIKSADGLYIRINLERLLGLSVDDIHKSTVKGFRGFDRDPFRKMIENIAIWRNGQGSDVPSTWGNTKIDAGATSYIAAKPREDKGHLIVHYYDDRSATLGNDVPEMPSCTLVSIITTVDGRIPGLGTCN